MEPAHEANRHEDDDVRRIRTVWSAGRRAPGAQHRCVQPRDLRGGDIVEVEDNSIPDRPATLLTTPNEREQDPVVTLAIRGVRRFDDIAPAELVLGACSVRRLAAGRPSVCELARIHARVLDVPEEDGVLELLEAASRSAELVVGRPRRRCQVCSMATRPTLDQFRVDAYPCPVCGDRSSGGRPLWMEAARLSVARWRVTFVEQGAATPLLASCTRPPRVDELPAGTVALDPDDGWLTMPACGVCSEPYRPGVPLPTPGCEHWIGRTLSELPVLDQPAAARELARLARLLDEAMARVRDDAALDGWSAFGELAGVAECLWRRGRHLGVRVSALARESHFPTLRGRLAWHGHDGRTRMGDLAWSIDDDFHAEPQLLVEHARDLTAALVGCLDQAAAAAPGG